jgi:exodeoxyribonuclease V alpha subunit
MVNLKDVIIGLVERKIFYNESNHYGVFVMIPDLVDNRPITIVGNFYNIELDSSYEFTGRYVENPRFGLQFQVDTFKKVLPTEREAVVRYLSGPSFLGIGKISAENIIEKYGVDVLDKIRANPDMSLVVRGIGKDRLDNLKRVILDKNETDEAVDLLSSVGIKGNIISNIISIYGDDTLNTLKDNPYQLIDEVSGIGFKTADKLGKALGIDDYDPRRIEGVVLDRVKSLSFDFGHSYISYDTLVNSFDSFDALYQEAYELLLIKGNIVMDEDRLYHYTQYDAEVTISDCILNIASNAKYFNYDDFEDALDRVESKINISFDENQVKALKVMLKEDVSILTGGPGTGKSTLLSGLVALMQSESPGLHITLCAPTGRAAKRLTELTNVNATTIHSALKWNLDNNEFGVNEFNPLDTDVVIVDEFSMVDTWLLGNLLKASKFVKKFVFVGDKDQLPSVTSGFVLGDMIASKAIKVIELKHNYRQEEGSEVIDLALQINDGQFSLDGFGSDVQFYDNRYGSSDKVVASLVGMALEKGYSIYDIQVLAPIYKGTSGIDALNRNLQNTFNPQNGTKRERISGARIFREGDKILQLKNQPDDGVYNGDIGILIEIDDDQTLIVDFDDGIYVEYDSTSLINISHAYCMSVHKAQGSEYPIVILLAHHYYQNMLGRRLYYTAITRSSKSLLLVGEYSAFERAVENGYEDKRNTYLKERLRGK